MSIILVGILDTRSGRTKRRLGGVAVDKSNCQSALKCVDFRVLSIFVRKAEIMRRGLR